MNKYIKIFMEDHHLKVGDEFRAKGLNIDETWRLDENGYLLDSMGVERGNVLNAFLYGKWEVEKVKKEPWKPKFNDKYWFVSHCGYVTCNTYYKDKEDKYILTHYPTFQTEEEARDYRWFLDKVDEYKKPFGFCEDNRRFSYDHSTKEVEMAYDHLGQKQGTIYFGGLENIEKFLEEVGEERIKKYMFGVYE